jgi:hypothetical protein
MLTLFFSRRPKGPPAFLVLASIHRPIPVGRFRSDFYARSFPW